MADAQVITAVISGSVAVVATIPVLISAINTAMNDAQKRRQATTEPTLMDKLNQPQAPVRGLSGHSLGLVAGFSMLFSQLAVPGPATSWTVVTCSCALFVMLTSMMILIASVFRR